MGRLLFLLPLIGSIIGGFVFLLAVIGANGAPQQAAGAAMALAFAVLPYVFCRSMQLMGQESRDAATDRLVAAINSAAGPRSPGNPFNVAGASAATGQDRGSSLQSDGRP